MDGAAGSPDAVPARPRQPGDGWVECACGQRHWGLHGAAGLLLARRDEAGAPIAVVLQHRATWSHHGGTWGVPGGARHPWESAHDAALREAAEEAGIDPAHVRVLGEHAVVHPDWSYTTVLAEEVVAEPVPASGDDPDGRHGAGTGRRRADGVRPRPTDDESLAVAWVPVDDVPALPLHPAFGAAWDTLLAALR